MSNGHLSSPGNKKLPLSPEEVTASWLSEVLGHKVKAIELTKSILNASASKLFITLTYDDDGVESLGGDAKASLPKRICVKGGFNPVFMARYHDILLNMYQRESDFFSGVAPSLVHINLPKSYWAGKDDSQGLVIMDDLTAFGVKFGEPLEAWPVERVMAAVEQLAGLHAGTWGKKLSDYPWAVPEFYEQLIWALCLRWDDLMLGADRPPVPDIVKDEKRIRAVLKKHFGSRNPRFRCLVHGDAHVGNTFTADGAPRFLDWQSIHLGSAFHDVAYFVSGSLTVEDRRAHEMRILDHYLDALARFGGPTLSSKDEEVIQEYRKSMLSGFNWLLAPSKLQNVERVYAMCERYGAAIVDHKTVELVESLPDVE